MEFLLMSPVRTLSPRAWRLAAGLVAASAALAVTAPAQGAIVYGDQVDRGDGLSGFTAWSAGLYWQSAKVPTQGVAISDDGRYAWLSYPTSDTARGLYRRDIAADTLRLVANDVVPTGATATPTGRISVITRRALSAADQNGSPDLYLLDAFTGAATLASVTDSGAAAGDVVNGTVSRDGSTVIWSTATTTSRRLLGGGAPTVVGDGVLETYKSGGYGLWDVQPPADLALGALSADGRTVALAGRQVVTPSGTVDVGALLPSTFAPSDVGLPVRISSDGAKAVVAGGDRESGRALVAVVDLATSTARIIQPTGLPSGSSYWRLLALATGSSAAVVEIEQGNRTYAVGVMNLTTGAITKVSGDYQDRAPSTFSFNGRYGLANSRSWMYAVPVAANATLPGGPGSAPATYLSYAEGCIKPVFIEPYGGRPTVSLTRPGLAPPSVSSMQVAARNLSNGVVMNQFTLIPGVVSTLPINGYYGAVRLEISLRYTSGQTGTNQVTVPAHTPPECYGNNGI
jgi:hypothetical protein